LSFQEIASDFLTRKIEELTIQMEGQMHNEYVIPGGGPIGRKAVLHGGKGSYGGWWVGFSGRGEEE
jgi:hypothetical protein